MALAVWQGHGDDVRGADLGEDLLQIQRRDGLVANHANAASEGKRALRECADIYNVVADAIKFNFYLHFCPFGLNSNLRLAARNFAVKFAEILREN